MSAPHPLSPRPARAARRPGALAVSTTLVATLSAVLAACGGGELNEASAAVVAGETDTAARALGARRDGSGAFTLAGFQLTPARADVVVGRSLELSLVDCPRLAGSSSDETNVRQCKPVVVLPGELSNWAVNGVAGGSAAAGTVQELAVPDDTRPRGLYTAPGAVPAGNPVAVSVDYKPLIPGQNTTYRLVARVFVVPAATCAWLHGHAELRFEAELDYHARVTAGGVLLTMNQKGRMNGRMQRVFDNGLYGVWQGTPTAGSVSIDDTSVEGDRVDHLVGSGAPAVGSEEFSGMQLTVNYSDCTYTVGGKMAVVAGYGVPNDVPRPRVVGSFGKGNVPIDSLTWLDGKEDMPPRPEATPLATYFPGGDAPGSLFGDGASGGSVGAARVRWLIQP